MFKTILVPTDGSPLSDQAVTAAIEFARLLGSRIVALSVAEPLPYMALTDGAVGIDPQEYERQTRMEAKQHVEKAAQAAAAVAVPCDVVTAVSFNPYEEIVKTADDLHCDAIFMASHGRKGLNRLFLGSETQKVLAHTTIPVMVFRDKLATAASP